VELRPIIDEDMQAQTDPILRHRINGSEQRRIPAPAGGNQHSVGVDRRGVQKAFHAQSRSETVGDPPAEFVTQDQSPLIADHAQILPAAAVIAVQG
jgi:hypothetical protein